MGTERGFDAWRHPQRDPRFFLSAFLVSVDRVPPVHMARRAAPYAALSSSDDPESGRANGEAASDANPPPAAALGATPDLAQGPGPISCEEGTSRGLECCSIWC